ncbi:hypothetical protein D3C85_1322750 [compost metagenome]
MGLGIIDIWKVFEQEELVIYAFEHEGRTGKFTINRRTGEATEPRPEHGSVGHAARYKVISAWREGALPERTQWAG